MIILKVTDAGRKWYQIILWWEIRRILYNISMYFVGVLSFYICYVTVPFIYVLIGFLLNIFYTFGWISELIFIHTQSNEELKLKYPKYAFLTSLLLSSLFVLGIAIFILL